MIKKIAVVLPAYNSGTMLDRQINSILMQEDISVDIYIMDDGSTDQTKTKIDEFDQKYKNIHIVESKRNHSKASQSFFFLLIELYDVLKNFDFVALSDHDDIWLPGKLKNSINVLDSCNASCYSSDFLSVKYDSKLGLSAPHFSNKSGKQTCYDHFFEGPGPGCTFVLKNSFYVEFINFISKDDRPKLLDNLHAHDWFIYMYAKENYHKWVIDNSYHMLYIQHEFNETGVNIGLQAYKKRLKLLFSGWYLFQVRSMINIISPASSVAFKLNRMSISDRLYFLLRLPKLRRRMSHAFIIGLFFCFAKNNKENKGFTNFS